MILTYICFREVGVLSIYSIKILFSHVQLSLDLNLKVENNKANKLITTV